MASLHDRRSLCASEGRAALGAGAGRRPEDKQMREAGRQGNRTRQGENEGEFQRKRFRPG